MWAALHGARGKTLDTRLEGAFLVGSALRRHPTWFLGKGRGPWLTGREQPATLSVKLCCTPSSMPLLLADFHVCLLTFISTLSRDRERKSF